ncbi:MAG: hypothetical protein L0G25_08515 [Psychrobacter sp.]|nr:hypothetical protein [Psychrobacter sp.]
MLFSVSVLSTVTVFYLGKKGWRALHKVVGITPGVLTYQDPQARLSVDTWVWQNLNVNKQHLMHLSDLQLRQLQYIDEKIDLYQSYQQSVEQQSITPALTEQQFVLHKLLHTRLAEMLASHYHLVSVSSNADKQAEANQLLQNLLNNIEQRLEGLLMQVEDNNLQDLRVMKQYMDSHD